jgi:hypothetical protein
MLPLTFHPSDSAGCRQALINATQLTAQQRFDAGTALKERISGAFTAARETAAYLDILSCISERK